MVENGYSTAELDKLTAELFRTAERTYPTKARKMLREQGKIGRKKLRENTKECTTKRTGNLLKGIRAGKVTKYKDDFQVRIKNTAHHAHLIEYGHSMVVFGKKTDKFVEGRYPARKTAEEMRPVFAMAVEEFVDEMLEEGLSL